MRFDIKKMNDKPIKIRGGGVNYLTVFSVIVFVGALILTMTSKYWLPDDRKIMNQNNETEMMFNNQSIKVDSYYADYQQQLGEIRFKILQDANTKDDLTFSMTYDGENAYGESNYHVIKGSLLPTTKENHFFQEVIVQFSLPEKFYYISIYVTQPDVKTQEIMLDYRSLKEKVLISKGDNYLIELDDLNIKIVKQESVVKTLNDEVDGIKKTIETLTQENKILETKIKAIIDENALKEKQSVIDLNKKSLEDYQKRLEEKTTTLEKEKQGLSDLENEKEKQM